MKRWLFIAALAIFLTPLPSHAAIAFDVASSSNPGSSPVCPSATMNIAAGASATVGVLVFEITNLTDTATAATWGSSSMTKVSQNALGNSTVSVWSVANPPSGSQTITVTCGGVATPVMMAESLSGASSLVTNVASTSSASATSLSNAITVGTTNAWVVVVGYEKSSNTAAFTSSETRRFGNQGVTAGSSRIIGDTGALATGSHTDSFNWTGAGATGIVQIEIDPTPVVTTSKFGFFQVVWW